MKKYLFVLFVLAITGACKSRPVKTSHYYFKIEDSTISVSQMQIDATGSILTRRFLNSEYERPVVSYDASKRQFIVEGEDNIGKEFITRDLLKSYKIFFYETYAPEDLVQMLDIKGTPGEEEDKKENFLRLMNFRPPGIAGNRIASVGEVKVIDTAKFAGVTKDLVHLFPQDMVFAFQQEIQTRSGTPYLEVFALKVNESAIAVHQHVDFAKMDLDNGGRPNIVIQFDLFGTKRFADMTMKNINRPIAIVVEGKVYSAPFVAAQVEAGNIQISGNFTKKEATQMANMLSAGELPLKLNFVR